MVLLWILVIGDLIGGFLAASAYIVERIPSLKKVSDALNSFKMPIGVTVFVIAFINIFNFGVGWNNYPKLTLIGGLLTGFILSVELFNKFNINEKTKDKIFNFASKNQIIIGIITLAIALSKILKIFFDVLNVVL